ncbi:MAG: carbohydrate binding domain-containing protein [Deinococcales bacterium]
MKTSKLTRWLLRLGLLGLLSLLSACPAKTNPPACDQSNDYALSEGEIWINNFETESIDFATDANGVGIGFVTWHDGSGDIKLSKEAANACSDLALPQQKNDGQVLQIEHKVVGWGGFTHAFSNQTLDTWVSQNWSSYEGLSFWFKGTNSGKDIQFELFDNRQIGNTGDSAERYFYRFKDDTSDWREVKIAFSELQRRSDWQPVAHPMMA